MPCFKTNHFFRCLRLGRLFLLFAALGILSFPVLANDTDSAAYFHLGGAIRFNYGWRDDRPSSQFQPELVRLDAKGQTGRLFGEAQYRWYDGFDAVHHAWLGWKLDDDSDLRAGIVQAPFGLLPYSAQTFWFNSDYYLGLSDDYDAGIVWQRKTHAHHWHAGIFIADEYGDAGRFGRYSFDVADTATSPYREDGQLNLRYEYTGTLAASVLKLGGSVRLGRLQDRRRETHERHAAAAIHADLKHGAFTTQFQWVYYHYDIPDNRLALSAFLFPFEIAAKAHVPSFNLVYDLPRSGWFDSITCYNNYSATLASGAGLRDSQQNATGCMFGKGKVLAYVDWIAGRNMWFSAGPGIGIHEPGQDRWHSRLNINIGYYF